MAEIWAFLEEPLKFDLRKMYLLITCAVYAVKEACLDPGWAGTSMLAMRLVDQVLPLAQALIFHCLPENFFFKKFRNLLI